MFLLVKNNSQINGCKPWKFWGKLGFWTLNENQKTVINHTECILWPYRLPRTLLKLVDAAKDGKEADTKSYPAEMGEEWYGKK